MSQELDRASTTLGRIAALYGAIVKTKDAILLVGKLIAAFLMLLAGYFGEQFSYTFLGFLSSLLVQGAVAAYAHHKLHPLWRQAVSLGVQSELERWYPLSKSVSTSVGNQSRLESEDRYLVDLYVKSEAPYALKIRIPVAQEQHVEAECDGASLDIVEVQPRLLARFDVFKSTRIAGLILKIPPALKGREVTVRFMASVSTPDDPPNDPAEVDIPLLYRIKVSE